MREACLEKKKKNVFKTVIKWVLLVFTVLASVFFFVCMRYAFENGRVGFF